MPKTRREVAQRVAAIIRPIEAQSQSLSAEAGRSIAALIEARQQARLPAHVGAQALARTTEAAQHLVLAANCFAEVHRELAGLAEDLGLGFGPDCPPNEGAEKPGLKVVAIG
ncbi:hypothetical protein [Sphingosinithalassobacter sp. LHW66-3]|uniref:hypothetical protein n=1 Tax=Sphingosinithalassobacter sp. LHW66-3 TaxID=3424718 RepID=UPI003D6AFCD3